MREIAIIGVGLHKWGKFPEKPWTQMMVETAKELEIPYTIIAAAGPTGTDARSMQMAQAGVATALIGIPNRYMHSMSEVVNLKDVDAIVKLSVAVIKKIGKTTSFIPN